MGEGRHCHRDFGFLDDIENFAIMDIGGNKVVTNSIPPIGIVSDQAVERLELTRDFLAHGPIFLIPGTVIGAETGRPSANGGRRRR